MERKLKKNQCQMNHLPQSQYVCTNNDPSGPQKEELFLLCRVEASLVELFGGYIAPIWLVV